jgi:hypothetical protein
MGLCANGRSFIDIRALVRHRAFQKELLTLMASLTEEGWDGRVRAAKSDAAAFAAIVAFRRRHGLRILDCDPSYYLAGLHRAIIRHPHFVDRAEKMPPDEDAMRARGIINYSEHWLVRHGLNCDVDSEFNPAPAKASD